MKDEVTLKPCPFCGAREIAHSYNHRSPPANVYFVCSQCGAGPYAENGDPETKEAWDAAGKLWNTRAAAQSEAVQELVEAMEVAQSDAHMLRRAIESNDPKAELLVRVGDIDSDLRKALASHRKATSEQ
ncbi:Lar family restriction alleviation protein [Pelagerythrobacter marinus]|uniref:Lar family restriction alleviation protein n=1 Tax=Pelagerythrobacter marinus TaxID=538382 RepID=UPI002AC9B5A0|nr:Lar family restriction alleviation protein [Pelagerythrobacter marinus]WPZ05464.1 Lar family restriction alleviation protein [Pelagerythrobacter marinus]